MHVPSAPLGPINLTHIIWVVVHSIQLIADIAPTACFHVVGAIKADIEVLTICTCAARAPRTRLSLSVYHQVALFEFCTHARVGVMCSNICENITLDHKIGPKWGTFSCYGGAPCALHA